MMTAEGEPEHGPRGIQHFVTGHIRLERISLRISRQYCKRRKRGVMRLHRPMTPMPEPITHGIGPGQLMKMPTRLCHPGLQQSQ
jgi:hypothetical protein